MGYWERRYISWIIKLINLLTSDITTQVVILQVQEKEKVKVKVTLE